MSLTGLAKRMIDGVLLWVPLLVILIWPGQTSASIPDFLNDVFTEFQVEYSSLRADKFKALCTKFDVDSLNTTNREDFLRICFLHDLLTTSDAIDCASSGILEIPYFWHWVEPNPRHSIRLLPDSSMLSSCKPPAKYARYASCADIDRLPDIFLSDLVTEEPCYFHPDCGAFNSFGWCSEREMAFMTVMRLWGFEGKIYQKGIHVYSVIWCEFKKPDGTTVIVKASVDNTFDTVLWQKVDSGTHLNSWLESVGAGTDIAWYNDVIRSEEQIETLKSVSVGEAARQRIRGLVRKALTGREE